MGILLERYLRLVKNDKKGIAMVGQIIKAKRFVFQHKSHWSKVHAGSHGHGRSPGGD